MSSKPIVLRKILNLNSIDVNAVDSNGDTPLIYAIRSNIKSNIKILFEREDLDFSHFNNSGKDAIDMVKWN